MDKALEKITELEKKIVDLVLEISEIKTKENERIQNIKQLEKEQNELERGINCFKSHKEDLESKQKNLNRYKRQTILYTALLLLFTELIIVVASIYMSGITGTLIFAFCNVLSIPGCIRIGDIGCYRLAKKLLEENNIEDIEKEINKRKKELDLTLQNKNNIRNELIELKNNRLKLEKEKYILETEKFKLVNLRNIVIKKYIDNNKELDNILNTEYEKEQQKQLVKKNGSMSSSVGGTKN